ncbi:hypothetical protein [Blastococcus sp. TF02-09]|uniref:hypothetical protein n=1 Tax=Blastococcus sp. TF02-09 TaxID=2250576 RepID=UPI0011BE4E17|nr:hypothetical protein [Blastococcus sp. TF02-9]
MKPMPARLAALVVIGVTAGLFILYQGLASEGRDRAVSLFFGCLALVGVSVMVWGWWRGPGRR